MDTHIETTCLVTDEACVAEVVLVLTPANRMLPARFVGKGHAKKHPKDQPDHDVASSLAYSRAFESLAEQLGRYSRARLEMRTELAAPPWYETLSGSDLGPGQRFEFVTGA